MLNLLYAVQHLDAARQLVLAQELDRRVDLMKDQLEPQLRDLVLDDEQQLVMLWGLAERLLRAEQLVELQVGFVADLTVEIDGGRDRSGVFVLAGFCVILCLWPVALVRSNTITQRCRAWRSSLAAKCSFRQDMARFFWA
jgi:hypothetical protein